MKKANLILSLLFLTHCSALADYWTQRANMPGSGRADGTGMAIGSKGYIGTGFITGYTKDWYEFDPITNTWTQKADFGGQPIVEASCFSIGNKGYLLPAPIGIDFWEYDPSLNLWTQKANFLGGARQAAVSFEINGKGYITTGASSSLSASLDDLWEYDPLTNSWTQKANLPGAARHYAAGFAIGGKGYVGTGTSSGTGNLNDFWEWDQATDTWAQKANFPGTPRNEGTGFSIGDFGYMGTGYGPTPQSNMWRYEPLGNSWTPIANFVGGVRVENVSFSIGNLGYLGTGWDGVNFKLDFWEYHPEDSTTGIESEEPGISDVILYPNPAKNTLTVLIDSRMAIDAAKLMLIDLSGRKIFEREVVSHKVEINISGIAAGTYLAQLVNEEKEIFKKKIMLE